jgi:hypothetical protein
MIYSGFLQERRANIHNRGSKRPKLGEKQKTVAYSGYMRYTSPDSSQSNK